MKDTITDRMEAEYQAQAEALNFRHLRDERRIVCDDPGIWVEDHGAMHPEAPHQFVLERHGSRIGFHLPIEMDEYKQVVDAAGPMEGYESGFPHVAGGWSWVLDDIGCHASRWDHDQHRSVDLAYRYRFENRAEQALVIALIRAAMVRHLHMFPKMTPPRSRVLFTPALKERIASGALLATKEE